MDRRQYELLSCIKQCYLDTNGDSAFQIKETGASLSARQFYLCDLKDNLVRVMDEAHIDEYSRGSGNELEEKMKALRSSSAMTFNILGNLHCRVKDPHDLFASHEYRIAYEHQIPTLKYGMPANLDAFLKGEKGDVLACEMKMLEWLTSVPAKLKGKYLRQEYYVFEDSASIFIDAAVALNASPAFACYDFAQMFKHSLALYNSKRSGEITAKNLALLNCVWEPPKSYDLSPETATWIAEQTYQEHNGFREFKRLMRPIEKLFQDELETNFSIEYFPVSEIIGQLSYPKEELTRLMRYQ